MHMIFDDKKLDEHFMILDVRGRGIIQNDIELIDVSGKAGAYFSHRKIPVRVLEVDIAVVGDNPSDLRDRIRYINRLLSVDEPRTIVFSDDDAITYHGIPADSSDDGDIVSTNRSTIVFMCADPYSYSEEKEHAFEYDVTTVINDGAEDAEPVFEISVLEPITFAMIQNQNEEYQMIGIPADDDVQEIDTKNSVLYENGSTIDTWNSASLDVINDSNIDSVDGVMGTDGAGIRADSYGTAKDKQRGPAVIKELSDAIQDFEIESTFDILSNRESENFRMIIYFYDENMNDLGHMGVKDNSRNNKRRVPIAKVGKHLEGAGQVFGDSSKRIDNARNTTLMYFRAKREGNRYYFYIGEWQNQKHITVWDDDYIDVDNEFQGKLKFIALFIGSYQDRGTPSRIRMNSVEVFELASIMEDQTPYIARVGDVITFDNVNNEILLNGENYKTEKDFGGTYFTLKKGENELVAHPSDSLAVRVKYRETSR